MTDFLTSALVIVVFSVVGTCGMERQNTTRNGKVLSIFQIVNFPNDPCVGTSSRNGTCYTSDECSSRGGTTSGTCAQGFGVCCIFSLSCGSTTAQNCTYLVQEATTSPASNPCIFTICKESDDICRIRLDFTTFTIAGPTVGTVLDAVTVTEKNGGAIGDCNTDSFSITSPGNRGSPVICGFNSGQHMIMDASPFCHKATFDFTGTGNTRQFDIKVTQYVCGDERGGPNGCLQYFTGNVGRIASFNFLTSSSVVSSTATHLSNQCYTICFRQEVGKCAICFNAVSLGTAVIDQGSFGLSLSSASGAFTGVQDSACTLDYLQIPGAERDAAGAMFAVGVIALLGHDRICGRKFGFSDTEGVGAGDNTESICTQQRPFRVFVKTSVDEATEGTVVADGEKNEQSTFPGGIIGFHLNFALQDC